MTFLSKFNKFSDQSSPTLKLSIAVSDIKPADTVQGGDTKNNFENTREEAEYRNGNGCLR